MSSKEKEVSIRRALGNRQEGKRISVRDGIQEPLKELNEEKVPQLYDTYT